MKRVMVTYAVRPDQVEPNERRIEAVFAQLQREQPPGIRYATFKLADGVSFLHLASIETADGSNPLVALETFQQFAGTLAERRVEAPVTVALQLVGSYGVLDR